MQFNKENSIFVQIKSAMKILTLLLAIILSTACATKPAESNNSTTYTITGSISVSSESDLEWITRYDKTDLEKLRERAAVEPSECDVLFFGSSSIRLWNSLKEDMAPLTVVNRGYGGATLRDLHYNYQTVMAHYRPKAFVFYCENDMSAKSKRNITAGDLFDLTRLLFERLERDYPNTPVYFLAIKHSERRENIRARQALFNALMKEYCDKSEQAIFIDTCTPLLTEEGKADPSFYLEDKLHLAPEGYAVWREVVRPFLIKD